MNSWWHFSKGFLKQSHTPRFHPGGTVSVWEGQGSTQNVLCFLQKLQKNVTAVSDYNIAELHQEWRQGRVMSWSDKNVSALKDLVSERESGCVIAYAWKGAEVTATCGCLGFLAASYQKVLLCKIVTWILASWPTFSLQMPQSVERNIRPNPHPHQQLFFQLAWTCCPIIIAVHNKNMSINKTYW